MGVRRDGAINGISTTSLFTNILDVDRSALAVQSTAFEEIGRPVMPIHPK
jgi:hypothetical protein